METAVRKPYFERKWVVDNLFDDRSPDGRRELREPGGNQAGWSLRCLGDRYTCDAETVRKPLRAAGVQLRPRNG